MPIQIAAFVACACLLALLVELPCRASRWPNFVVLTFGFTASAKNLVMLQ